MRSYRTFPPLPGRLSRAGKGGKVFRSLRDRPPSAGLIEMVKRDPSSLFTQHPCAVPHKGDCAVRWKEGPFGPLVAAPGPGRPTDAAFNQRFPNSILAGTDQPLWRYISVALFLKSPSAGVTRYPCPVEPGLSSWTAFRPAHATVCLPRKGDYTRCDGESQRGKFPALLYFCPVCGIIFIV